MHSDTWCRRPAGFCVAVGLVVGSAVLAGQAPRTPGDRFAARVLPAAAPQFFDAGTERFGVLWSGMRRSTDGGKTWLWVVPISSDPFGQPFFYFSSEVVPSSPEIAFLGGGRGTWRTTDAGESWTRVFERSFGGIAFAADATGWLALNDGDDPRGWSYVTRDRGVSWQRCAAQDIAPQRAQLLDGGIGWGLATTPSDDPRERPALNRVVTTRDGGCSWRVVPTMARGGYHHIFFVNDREGWIADDTPLERRIVLRHTSDGGRTWDTLRGPEAELLSMYFTDARHGWLALGDDEGEWFVATTDGGALWRRLPWADARGLLPAAWGGGRFHLALAVPGARIPEGARRSQAQLEAAATRKVLALRAEGFAWDPALNYASASIEVTIDAEGRVIDAKAVEQSYPEVMQNALDAARDWRFDPVRLGVPAAGHVTGPLGFIFRPGTEPQTSKPPRR